MGLSCYQHHDLGVGGSENDGQVEGKTMDEEQNLGNKEGPKGLQSSV